MRKRFLFICIIVLWVSVGMGACTTDTIPTATIDTPLTAAQTDTPTPTIEEPVYDLGPIPDVRIKCLFKRQDGEMLQQAVSIDGSWRQFRHDTKLTGRSPLIGDINCPQLLWSYDLGARLTWVAITPDSAAASEKDLPVSGEIGNRWSVHSLYEVDGLFISLDENGSTIVDPSNAGNHKIGDFLPDKPGYERISCDTGVFQVGAGGYEPLPCFLQNWNAGQWETVWTSVTFSGFTNNMSTRGQPIVGDFDDDGDLETAVLPWYDMHILDLVTGRLEQTGNYQDPTLPGDPTTGRPYGLFGAYNLDDDPKSEFVIMGDFELFVSVLGWRDGKLVELWDHQIEAGTFLNKAAHQTIVNPVADIDGDGLPEIVTSIYNETGDQRWHVIGFNGLNGEIKLDLVDCYLSGLGDLDGDNVAEIFTTTTSSIVVPEYGPSTIYSFLTGSPESIWHSETTGFENYELPAYPDNVNSRATYGRRMMFLRDDWIGGGPVFITGEQNEPEPAVTLHFYQMVGGSIAEIGAVRGPNLKLRSFPSSDPSRGILIEATTRTPENTLQLAGLKAEILYSGRTQEGDGHLSAGKSLLTGTVVGTLRSGDEPTIITQGYGEKIHALKYPQGSNTLEEVWQVGGRGMADGTGNLTSHSRGFISVLLADILGNGDLAVIVVTSSEDGFAVVKALNADGQSIWESTVELPGEPPNWNFAGIGNWMVGHFNSTAYQDILVSYKETKYASDQLFLLDGRTGKVLWTKRMGGYFSGEGCDHRDFTGAGGSHMAVFDWDGDGLDEILNLFGALFAVYDGSEGATLFNRWTTTWCMDSRQIFSQGFLKRPIPVVADFLGDGSEQILFAGMDATIAVVQFDGSVDWHTPFFSGSPIKTMQGVGDMDGDSVIELVSIGHCGSDDDEIQILDARDGRVQWSLSMPELCDSMFIPSHVSTVDLDGDGRDEALFTHKNNIYTVGVDPQAGAMLLWQLRVEPDEWSAELSEVVIADVDGSGKPQLIVNTASGYLYGFGGQPFPTPAPTLSPEQEISHFIYDDAPERGWDIGVFMGEIDIRSEGAVHSGQFAIEARMDQPWGSIGLWTNPLDTSQFLYLEFYINGGPQGGQQIDVLTFNEEEQLTDLATGDYTGFVTLPPEEWLLVRIPVEDLNPDNDPVTGFAIANQSDDPTAAFYIDEIRFVAVGP